MQCGLVTNDPKLYHEKLRHFFQNKILIDDVEEVKEQIYEFRAFEGEAVVE